MSEKTRVGQAATTLRAIPLVLMAVGIAVVDTLTDLEIAVGVFQIAIVLLAVRFFTATRRHRHRHVVYYPDLAQLQAQQA
ncbi:hypothetical protein [Dickeya ananatis]